MKNDTFLADRPDLIAEWDYEKNSSLSVSSVTIKSTIIVWWKCRLGHSYQQAVFTHTRGSGCPYCAHRKVLAGFNDLASQSPELASQMDCNKNDGLTPDMIMPHSNKKIWWKCSAGHSWKESPNQRSKGLGCPYCSGHRAITGINDLATLYPDVASEWDHDRNSVSPDSLLPGSDLKAWWKCPNGHSYDMCVSGRALHGFKCPICSGHRIIAGINDLSTIYPKLASEWDPDKNSDLTPSMVSASSSKKVWWKCSLGHSWRTAVSNRSNGTGCPFCSNRKLLPGFNDALTRYPFINDYWDHEKNLPLEPSNIMPSCLRQMVWWKCDTGHSWKSYLISFIKNPTCPYCTGRRVPERDITLSVGYPAIALEWDYEKNGTLSPDTVRAGSNLDVWWICPKGHSYQKRVCRRVFESSCPYCSGWYVSSGINDLSSLSPEIAAEWDYEKNFPMTPRDVHRGSSKKVWWICPKKHSYQSTVSDRAVNKQGCPYCKNRKVIPGFNDLATLHPDLVSEWDYEKNLPLLPSQVVPKSGKRVWWICGKGHSWDAIIATRAASKKGCPYCRGVRVIIGETDFATLNPSLLKEWDFEKNGNISPYELSAYNTLVAWWKCAKGHSWQSPLCDRTNGGNCPFCQSVKPYYSRLI